MADQFQRADEENWALVTSGLRFPAYEPVSESLGKAIAGYNARVSSVTTRLNNSRQAVADAIAKVDAGEFGDFVTALEQSKLDAGVLIQELATLWADRVKLAAQAVAEFKAEVAPAELEYDKTVEKVTADFERIGSGAAAMPGAGVDGETADMQLAFLVKNRNVHTAAAFAKVSDARARLDGANGQVGASNEGRAKAQTFVQRIARKMAAV